MRRILPFFSALGLALRVYAIPMPPAQRAAKAPDSKEPVKDDE